MKQYTPGVSVPPGDPSSRRDTPSEGAHANIVPKVAKKRRVAPAPPEVSRWRQPADLSVEEWQIALRRQFGRAQNFRLKNVGKEAMFSEFDVTNPATKKTYRVAIRGSRLGENYCACPDFAVNTLGTCKHIEWTLAKLRRTRGAKQALANGFHPPYSEIYLRHGAQRAVMFRSGVGCPPALLQEAARYFDEGGVLKPEGYPHFEALLSHTAPNGHEVRCYEDAMTFVAQVRDQTLLRRRIDHAFPKGIHSPAWNTLLKLPLYEYQREGTLFAAKAGRSLLADDMGLGKTIQAVATAEILARTMGVERVLVVAPISVKYQWQQEIERCCGRSVQVLEGLLASRARAYATDSFFKITGYDSLHLDLDLIQRWRPDLIILDEAQRIKNWKTRRARSVKQLASPYALVLTGTPLENRLEEVHSIVEFVDRFHLGPLFRFLSEHQTVDEVGKVIGYRNLSHIRETLKPLLIRRTKAEVLQQLPKRLDKNFFVPMTPQQMKHHEENQKTVGGLVKKWQRFGFLTETERRWLMIALQNMRMVCNSTYLLDETTHFGTKVEEVADFLAEVYEDPSAKVVVFSQWLRTHELLARHFKARRWTYALYHGGISGQKRRDLVQQFKDDPRCRALLATDAGGVGLNLQHASVVVNMDLPWNPAVLEQRIGRVHRLGQARPVRVVNFIAQGTIEHGMLDVIAFKKSLFEGVLDQGQDAVLFGGTRMKRFMEGVQKATEAIPPSGGPGAPPSHAGVSHSTVEKAEGRSGNGHDRNGASHQDPMQQAWAETLSTGLSFLEKLSHAVVASSTGSHASAQETLSNSLIHRDEKTGAAYLKLPLPPPDQLQKLASLLQGFAGLADFTQAPSKG